MPLQVEFPEHLGVADAEQVGAHLGLADAFQVLLRGLQARADDPVHLADLEREGLGRLVARRQRGHPRLLPRRAEAHRAAEGARLADDVGHAVFGDAVLQGAHRAVRAQVGQQLGQRFLVGRLLGQQEHQVISARHLIQRQGLDRHVQVERTRHRRAMLVQRVDMFLVVVHQIDRLARLGHQRADDRAQGAHALMATRIFQSF